jgi:hypothetical protein
VSPKTAGQAYVTAVFPGRLFAACVAAEFMDASKMNAETMVGSAPHNTKYSMNIDIFYRKGHSNILSKARYSLGAASFKLQQK